MRTFVEVGTALLRIRDERLYRTTYSTFEDYCRERWDMRREVADRTIRSAEIASAINPNGLADVRESQARELVGLEPEQAMCSPPAWEPPGAVHSGRVC